uniref:FBD domain-containing protein n=1 Tax=Setaria italica TaxID=4555 RepID=K4A0S0_SETIT
MVNCQYLMEGTTLLPNIENLHLCLVTCGHAIGACVFYMLKICTSIRRLNLEIDEGIEEEAACSLGCVCHQPHDWETKELFFNSLEVLNICGLSVADCDCDFAFVKRLLGWMPVLKTITVNFDPSAIVDEELCEELLCLSGPETCMKIYLYRNGAKVMYTPVG